MDRKQYRLYIITDHTWLNGHTLEEDTERALRGGATLVQLREKDVDDETYILRAQSLKVVCDRYSVPLIINDNVAVARAVGAAGVHLGASDGSIRAARMLLGPAAIIGATAKTVEAAQAAEAAGADYIGCGAVFGTTTKADAKTITLQQFRAVTQAVSVPVVAIGGLQADNLNVLADSPIAGVAVVSAVMKADDPRAAAAAIRQRVLSMREKRGRRAPHAAEYESRRLSPGACGFLYGVFSCRFYAAPDTATGKAPRIAETACTAPATR